MSAPLKEKPETTSSIAAKQKARELAKKLRDVTFIHDDASRRIVDCAEAALLSFVE
jgi:hypothetical protein